jgi:hypothetical protein
VRRTPQAMDCWCRRRASSVPPQRESSSSLVGHPAVVCKSPYPSILRHRVLRLGSHARKRGPSRPAAAPGCLAAGSAVRNFHCDQCIWHATRNFHPVGRSIAAVGRVFVAGSEPGLDVGADDRDHNPQGARFAAARSDQPVDAGGLPGGPHRHDDSPRPLAFRSPLFRL